MSIVTLTSVGSKKKHKPQQLNCHGPWCHGRVTWHRRPRVHKGHSTEHPWSPQLLYLLGPCSGPTLDQLTQKPAHPAILTSAPGWEPVSDGAHTSVQAGRAQPYLGRPRCYLRPRPCRPPSRFQVGPQRTCAWISAYKSSDYLQSHKSVTIK